jgi:hypothetical protein
MLAAEAHLIAAREELFAEAQALIVAEAFLYREIAVRPIADLVVAQVAAQAAWPAVE